MKQFLSRLLAMVGLVPARRHAALSQAASDLRAGSLEWKTKAGQALARVKSLEAEVKRQSELADRYRAAVEKLRGRRDHVTKLRARLAEVERELTVARDHLMTIEVKLDILEGAANVLDLRTRAAVSRPRSGSGASV
jgi:chromosome segregation ATPase